MDKDKEQKLKEKGWIAVTVQEFLGLTDEEIKAIMEVEKISDNLTTDEAIKEVILRHSESLRKLAAK